MKSCLYTGLVPSPGELKSYLASHNIELVEGGLGKEPGENELIAMLRDVDATLVGGAYYNQRVLDASPKLKIIARIGVGYDRVDYEVAAKKGIYVTITPIPELAFTLAEHTFALLLSYMRSIPFLNDSVRNGSWEPTGSWSRTDDLYYKTLGLLGLGRIGGEVAKRARAFGMRTLYHDVIRRKDLEESLGITHVPLDALFAEADVLSIHTPLTNETRGLVSDGAFAKMKPTAVLVNTARGPIVDEKALLRALKEKRLAGACLDVMAEEPPTPSSPFYNFGQQFPNMLFTPHCAVSGHTIGIMARAAAEEVVRVLEGGKPLYAINKPVL